MKTRRATLRKRSNTMKRGKPNAAMHSIHGLTPVQCTQFMKHARELEYARVSNALQAKLRNIDMSNMGKCAEEIIELNYELRMLERYTPIYVRVRDIYSGRNTREGIRTSAISLALRNSYKPIGDDISIRFWMSPEKEYFFDRIDGDDRSLELFNQQCISDNSDGIYVVTSDKIIH